MVYIRGTLASGEPGGGIDIFLASDLTFLVIRHGKKTRIPVTDVKVGDRFYDPHARNTFNVAALGSTPKETWP